MLQEYKDQVLSDYHKKREENRLSTNLANPSPGRLRDECLIVYLERYQQKDDDILRLFFTSKNNDGDYSKSIENFEVDKLRPLVKLLNGGISRPNPTTINLLAWLIDFEPRPYRFSPSQPITPTGAKTADGSRGETPQGPVVIDGDSGKALDPPATTPEPPTKWNFKTNQILGFSILLSLLILLTSSGGYLVWKLNSPQCMYWTNDHYELIACDQDTITSAIPFNEKAALLRRITRRDTLTQNAIGHIWYAKPRVDSVDFFTDSGTYPLDNRKRLLPVTLYILKKYVFDKRLLKP